MARCSCSAAGSGCRGEARPHRVRRNARCNRVQVRGSGVPGRYASRFVRRARICVKQRIRRTLASALRRTRAVGRWSGAPGPNSPCGNSSMSARKPFWRAARSSTPEGALAHHDLRSMGLSPATGACCSQYSVISPGRCRSTSHDCGCASACQDRVAQHQSRTSPPSGRPAPTRRRPPPQRLNIRRAPRATQRRRAMSGQRGAACWLSHCGHHPDVREGGPHSVRNAVCHCGPATAASCCRPARAGGSTDNAFQPRFESRRHQAH